MKLVALRIDRYSRSSSQLQKGWRSLIYAMSVNENNNCQFHYWHFNKFIFHFVHRYWCHELTCIKGYCISAKKMIYELKSLTFADSELSECHKFEV